MMNDRGAKGATRVVRQNLGAHQGLRHDAPRPGPQANFVLRSGLGDAVEFSALQPGPSFTV